MVKTSAGRLMTRQTHCLEHTMTPVTLPVAGVDFHALSMLSPSSPYDESIDRCAYVSCSLVYADSTVVWSNSVHISLEGKSLLEIDKGDHVLIPVYNPLSRSNESFIPMRVSVQREKGVGIIVFTPSVILKNELDQRIWIRMGESEQIIESNSMSPLHVSGIPTQNEWMISVKCTEEEEWSQIIPVTASQIRLTLVHAVIINLFCYF